jgi:hypothetical protein
MNEKEGPGLCCAVPAQPWPCPPELLLVSDPSRARVWKRVCLFPCSSRTFALCCEGDPRECKSCVSQKSSCFPSGLPRYLSPQPPPTTLHYTPIYTAIFLFLFSLRPDASDTLRTYILRILFTYEHLFSSLYNLTHLYVVCRTIGFAM